MSEFRYDKDADGIVVITMDMDGPVNAMTQRFPALLGDVVDRLEQEQGLCGVILASAKDTFFAGGDLTWLLGIEPGDAMLWPELRPEWAGSENGGD